MRAGRSQGAGLRGLVRLRGDGALVKMLEMAWHLDLVDVELVILIQYILETPLVLDPCHQILIGLPLMSRHCLLDG